MSAPDTGDSGGGGVGSPCNPPTSPQGPPSTPPTGGIAEESYKTISVAGGNVQVLDASGCPPTGLPVIKIIDSLKKLFPCASVLVIDSLSKISAYSAFVAPFQTNIKPDLIWQSGSLPWNTPILNSTSITYQLGVTSSIGRSSTITLNTSMLQQSSELFIAAAAIHETLHAYINYLIETNVNFTPPPTYNGTQPWMVSLDYWAMENGLPSNYRDHYEMLSDYFDKAVAILKTWDKSNHTDQQYEMAMLYGLNTNDFLALPVGNSASLSVEYNNILSKYNITPSMLDTYWKTQLTSSTEKLPTGCPTK